MWALIVDGEVELVRAEAPRLVLESDAAGRESDEVTLTDEELAERGWVEVMEVDQPPGPGMWAVEIVQVAGVWTQVWSEL